MPPFPLTPTQASGDGLRLVLLEQPCLIDGAARWRLPPRDAALAAWLALHGRAPRSRLARLLWPDAGAAAAGRNLRQRLYHWRHALARSFLDDHGDTLGLAEGVRHELAAPEEALRHDAQALRGELLGDHGYEEAAPLAAWAAAERLRWRQRRRELLLTLARGHEAAGDADRALPYAQRLCEESPTQQAAVRLLMRLLLQRGDRAGALAAFERCGEALRASGEPPEEETVALARLVGRSAPAGAGPSEPALLPLALRRPPRTVGREALLTIARERLALDGVVLLRGPAGIGKSRLLEELAVDGDRTLRLAASPGELTEALPARLAAALLSRRPPATLAEEDTAQLHRLARGAPRPAGGVLPAGRVAVLRRALDAAAAAGLSLVAIDDLPWADPASLDLLVPLWPRRGGEARGPGWLLTARDGPLPATVGTWLDGLQGGFDPVLPVPPLQAVHVAELLRTVCTAPLDARAWGERLHAHCGGHPLHTLQVLRELRERLPRWPEGPPQTLPVPGETLRLVVRRLGELDETARRLAMLAALCGGEPDAAFLQRLLGCDTWALERAWRHLEALHVLAGPRFSHEMLRQAVLEAIPPPLAALLHREIAQALPAAPPGRRAEHWVQAGCPGPAAADLGAAADEALARDLPTAATDALLRAAALHREAGDEAASVLARWRAGHLLLAASSADDALRLADELLSAAATPGDRARALELRARVRIERHEAAALDDAERACDAATEAADAALLARARLALAQAWSVLGRHAQALRLLRMLAEHDDAFDDQARHQRDDLHAVVLAALGRRREAVQVSRKALQSALARGQLAVAAGCAGNLGVQLSCLGDMDEAGRHFEQAIALARQAGVERGFVTVDEAGLAGNLGDQGHFAEALARLERAAEVLRGCGYPGWAVNADNDRATLLLRLGRPELARQLLAEPPPDTPAFARAGRHFVLARVAQWQGGSGLAAVREAARLLEEGGAMGTPYVAEKIALELARATGPDEAAARAAQALRWAARQQHVAMGWYAGMVRTEALTALGRAGEAAVAADALAGSFPKGWQAYGLYLPELWLVVCRAWAGAGRRDACAALAAEGAGWIRARIADDVPEVHRSSFLQRNPFNRRLLELAAP